MVPGVFSLFLSKRERGETRSELSFRPDYLSDFCLELRVGCFCFFVIKVVWQPLSPRIFALRTLGGAVHI